VANETAVCGRSNYCVYGACIPKLLNGAQCSRSGGDGQGQGTFPSDGNLHLLMHSPQWCCSAANKQSVNVPTAQWLDVLICCGYFMYLPSHQGTVNLIIARRRVSVQLLCRRLLHPVNHHIPALTPSQPTLTTLTTKVTMYVCGTNNISCHPRRPDDGCLQLASSDAVS
jgi:hypothetical protein